MIAYLNYFSYFFVAPTATSWFLQCNKKISNNQSFYETHLDTSIEDVLRVYLSIFHKFFYLYKYDIFHF